MNSLSHVMGGTLYVETILWSQQNKVKERITRVAAVASNLVRDDHAPYYEI